MIADRGVATTDQKSGYNAAVIETITRDRQFERLVHRLTESTGVASADGLWGSSVPIVAALAARACGRRLLYVTAHLEDADRASEDMDTVLGGASRLLSAWETLPGEGAAVDEIGSERMALCTLLHQQSIHQAKNAPTAEYPLRIVAPVQALMQPVPAASALEAHTITVRRGQTLDREELLTWLGLRGFQRLDMVEEPGDFAARGGIVDVFAHGDTLPVRIEFFGDEVESLRHFDLGTHRSQEQCGEVRIVALPHRQADRGDVTSFLSYLPPDALIAWAEPAEIQETGATLWSRLNDPAGMYPVHHLFEKAAGHVQLLLGRFGSGVADEDRVAFKTLSLQRFSAKSEEAVAELVAAARQTRVTVYCDNHGARQRLRELVRESGGDESSLETPIGILHAGFQWGMTGPVFVAHHEIFHQTAPRRRLRKIHATRPIESWLDLQQGDYVVHAVHGIARFRGMQKMTKGVSQKNEEFLTLEFDKKAVLHVPASQIDLVQKYIGAGGVRPALSTLGGTRWKSTKERVERAVEDLAAELLRLQAIRESSEGISFPMDSAWQKEFEASFPYTETEDQIESLADIKRDMCKPRPMDRLLCGDVGYGKTELAVRAAFKAVEYGKQVAVLVPTTVLAEQHFRTFTERLKEYPFAIGCLSRFRTKSEQDGLVKQARKGQVDILIGTHRLLSQDVGFADLGLVVIDEEQRFGVEHKERLKCLRETVDVLTLTATPIPRTLHLSMLGIRDISALETPPLDRRDILTRVCHFDPELIRSAVIREMNREGQVYFIHNRVQSIVKFTDRLRQIVPEARIIYGHGQMPGHELENVMHRFLQREADILVATTIIESGIDIPTVNTIFINNADQFGLADLHQLRGRVGRYKFRAYCYLLLPNNRQITPVAAKRLKAIEEYSSLGAGFRIAMRDLEIRGAGNILGKEQSGHIGAVGYEMYCQLLDSAARRMRNDPAPVFKPVHLELDVAAFVPENYIRSEKGRMEIYRRVAACRTTDDIGQLDADLRDAYGVFPQPVQRLLELAEIRILAQRWPIRSIIVRRPDVVFTLDNMGAVEPVFRHAPGIVRIPDDHTLHLRLTEPYFEPGTLLSVLRKLLRGPQSDAPAPVAVVRSDFAAPAAAPAAVRSKRRGGHGGAEENGHGQTDPAEG